MKGYLKLCLELVIHSLDCRNVTFCNWNTKFMLFMFHLFPYSFQLPRTTRTHNSILYPGATQRFSILCWLQRNKSYSRGWISVSLQLKIKKGSIDLKKLCLCTASLVLSMRLAVHKQSFLNLLLRQNGRHLTKVYWGILWLWRGGEGEGGQEARIKKGSIDLKKLCLCTASLVLSMRLAVHKQSFLNLLLRQNGRHLTKVYWGILWLWRGGEGEGGQEACTEH